MTGVALVRADLDNTPVTRTLRVPTDIRLSTLHSLLQAAFGFTNSHLHQFRDPRTKTSWTNYWELQDYMEREGWTQFGDNEVLVSQVLTKPEDVLEYEYDYGDGWAHTITVLEIDENVRGAGFGGNTLVELVEAQGGGPVEDSGGPYALAEMWAWAKGEDVGEALWGGTWEDRVKFLFGTSSEVAARQQILQADVNKHKSDLAQVNLKKYDAVWYVGGHPRLPENSPYLPLIRSHVMQKTGNILYRAMNDYQGPSDEDAERATAPMRVFLDVIGDGVPLTQAGYLKPQTVKKLLAEFAERTPEFTDAIFPSASMREGDQLEIYQMREMARKLKLVRKYKGQLLPIASRRHLASDPQALLAHIAYSLAPHLDEEGPFGGKSLSVHEAMSITWLAAMCMPIPEDVDRDEFLSAELEAAFMHIVQPTEEAQAAGVTLPEIVDGVGFDRWMDIRTLGLLEPWKRPFYLGFGKNLTDEQRVVAQAIVYATAERARQEHGS
ncbi:MAG: plasmid pRiA4b ORF-3 family protein [Actinomycetaceae bacterium]|nr:plasmid pRiA4b ORF-3 family protein [Actinomycetaceae bacterium]